MHRWRLEQEWGHTATICALIANCHRNSKKHPRPFTAADFNPFTPEKVVGIHALAAFCK